MTQKNNNTILLSFYLNDELFETIYTKKNEDFAIKPEPNNRKCHQFICSLSLPYMDCMLLGFLGPWQLGLRP